MKLAIFEVEDWECNAFQGLKESQQVEFESEALSPENASQYSDAEVISAFIYSDMSADTLKKFDNLKMIATRSTGFDHIDTDYCKKNNIKVCNVPTYGENTVAEHAFALMLAIAHNLTKATDRTRKGDFSQQGLQGFDLRGKTLGVIGTGNIGQCAIEIAQGFRMEVVAFDVKPKEELTSKLGFRYASMDEVLSSADIITVHVPGNKKTYHLISEDEFDKMKEGVILINTSRGSVVDVDALVKALSEGKVAAAGLDVLPEEPVMREEAELLRSVYRREHNLEELLADHVLLRLRNVLITPHSAFNTREAVQRILDTTRENIESFVEGKPENVVVGAS
ncbi:hydroxyacid dehydrogenase [Phormidium sp. CCY1219]|uniref:hydroxyacid dehydrogenase n=1 Tax=Phormidium sp. CCY1219 TaxID=2886104 RepID=UPI002D1F1351|nr:hydroxyacid dehydrogenase [Phormidium sp. CCY1219]MEB3829620.1 NAD(P)-binding domain-containing protein [Phormidium sp. CCY1219]